MLRVVGCWLAMRDNSFSSFYRRTGSLVPTIATELISASLLVVVVAFWVTLDLGQQHDDIPTMSNYNEFASIVKEKGYLFSMFQNGSPGM